MGIGLRTSYSHWKFGDYLMTDWNSLPGKGSLSCLNSEGYDSLQVIVMKMLHSDTNIHLMCDFNLQQDS